MFSKVLKMLSENIIKNLGKFRTFSHVLVEMKIQGVVNRYI